MMKRFLTWILLILMVWLLSLQCQAGKGYHLHIGKPFYSSDQLSYRRFLGEDAVPDTAGRSLRLRGIYTVPDPSSMDVPLLRFHDEQSGLHHASLLTGLEAEDGDLVEVSGTVRRDKIVGDGPVSVPGEYVLVPQEVHLVQPSSRLKQVAQEAYLRIRETLQESITPEGSRLVLPAAPRWFVVWSKTGSFIVSFRHTDLMYQAEVDCIIDETSELITHVYAWECFKGE